MCEKQPALIYKNTPFIYSVIQMNTQIILSTSSIGLKFKANEKRM